MWRKWKHGRSPNSGINLKLTKFLANFHDFKNIAITIALIISLACLLTAGKSRSPHHVHYSTPSPSAQRGNDSPLQNPSAMHHQHGTHHMSQNHAVNHQAGLYSVTSGINKIENHNHSSFSLTSESVPSNSNVISNRSVSKSPMDHSHHQQHHHNNTNPNSLPNGKQSATSPGGKMPLHQKLINVTTTLEMKALWDEFNELGTEMIVTKAGR